MTTFFSAFLDRGPLFPDYRSPVPPWARGRLWDKSCSELQTGKGLSGPRCQGGQSGSFCALLEDSFADCARVTVSWPVSPPVSPLHMRLISWRVFVPLFLLCRVELRGSKPRLEPFDFWLWFFIYDKLPSAGCRSAIGLAIAGGCKLWRSLRSWSGLDGRVLRTIEITSSRVAPALSHCLASFPVRG